MITVAVDAMGGDLAPGAVVAGALQAARHRGVAVTLTGPVAILREQIELQGGALDALLTVIDAPDTVGMDESPLVAHRRKPGQRGATDIAIGQRRSLDPVRRRSQ